MARILSIEDDPDLQHLIGLSLHSNGYEIQYAFNGKEGYEKAHSGKPDLILLDLMLPKIDGYWVCSLLKHDERHSKTPIIIITAKSGDENIKLAKECGADAYIVKPFEIEDLLARIAGLLKK